MNEVGWDWMEVIGEEEHIYNYFLEQGVHTTESEYDENWALEVEWSVRKLG